MDIRLGGGRGRTEFDGVSSRHSFAFGSYYEDGNTSFGLLLAHNEDRLVAGHGYDRHPHAELEIVTWMLSGALVHRDELGHGDEFGHGDELVPGDRSPLVAGQVQRVTAGSGVQHSEHAGLSAPAHYVQMWVLPAERGLAPAYDRADFGDRLGSGRLIPVASGLPEHAAAGAIALAQPDAGFLVARLGRDERCPLPDAAYLHVFLARGAALLTGTGADHRLDAGDAARVTAAAGLVIAAEQPGTEVCVWQMRSALG